MVLLNKLSDRRSVTREPRARDSGAKGPREYWWWHRAYGVLAPSIGSIGGKLGSFSGNPRAKGNTGIKGSFGNATKGSSRSLYIQSTQLAIDGQA